MKRLTVMLLLATPALAQEVDPATGREARVPNVTEVDFLEDVEINGQMQRPSVVGVVETPARIHPPMLHLRSTFAGEITRSVELMK